MEGGQAGFSPPPYTPLTPPPTLLQVVLERYSMRQAAFDHMRALLCLRSAHVGADAPQPEARMETSLLMLGG